MKTTKTKPLILLTFIAIILLGGYVIFTLSSIQSQLGVIESEIMHVDEEVDEAASGVKRILARQGLSTTDATGNAKAAIEVTEHDFGVIRKEDGAVTTTFQVHNSGSDPLLLGDISTSCSCTSATVDISEVEPNGTAIVTVKFDPNVHEEPDGRFSRMTYIPTNDPDTPEIEFTIFVEIEK